MSNLSGYDSEVVGFESISSKKRSETSCSTQTSEWNEAGVSSQTYSSKDCGSTATPEELNAQDQILKEYPTPGLNEFLRRAVPAMLDQLDENDKEIYGSSDSEEEETLKATLMQEIPVPDCHGAGDQPTSVLALSWSSAGHALAVSTGRAQHENWCTHDGLIRIYSAKRAAGDKLVHTMDINENNCVSVVEYHPSVAAMLAYGTTAGEVVICNLTESMDTMQLTTPSGCHGSSRVTALLWADPPLANIYLTMMINRNGKRRAASDQILISSGSDGTVNVWRVNSSQKVFETVVSYAVNELRKPCPDITCFDFVKSCPLRPMPTEDKCREDVFVVGTKRGTLFLCQIEPGNEVLDPVLSVLEGHRSCVVGVAFCAQRVGLFVSASIDSELRLYDVEQACALKVFHVTETLSCVTWLPLWGAVALLGVTGGVALYAAGVGGGRRLPVDGLSAGTGQTTALAASRTGAVALVAAGDADGRVRVWELPRLRHALPDDF